jgi:hypothetical protein
MIEATDEQGRPGSDIAASALKAAGAGGTLVLNLFSEQHEQRIAAITPGWHIHRVTSWADLIDFAREFTRRNYEAGRLTR